MPSPADELAAVVAGLRPLANDLALADTCQVLRAGAAAVDSRGNRTATEVAALTTRCALRAGGLRPRELAVADRVQSVAPYAVDLPYGTDVRHGDALRVNGTRRFEVLGVLQAGGYGVFAVAVCEERS